MTAYTGVDQLDAMAAAANYNRWQRDVVLGLARGGEILEFGAGTGNIARLVRDAGGRLTCVEIDPALRDRLVRDGLPTHLDLAETAAFDLIYTHNVLEHVEDDAGTLAALAEHLRPGGRLCVLVPAFRVLYSSMDRRVGHFRRYRRTPLVRLVERAGLVVDDARYVDALGFAAALVYRAFDRSDGRLDPRSIAAYDRLVFPLSRRVDRVAQRFVGKNVLVVAHRP
jgi:SAM-dependent methyltransferase